MTRLNLLILVATVGTVRGVCSDPDDAAFARMPYLQFATTNAIHVVWRTEGPVEPVVKYGSSADKLTQEVEGDDIVVRASLGKSDTSVPERWKHLRTEENLKLRKLHSAPVGTFQYEAKLTGLDPARRYYYAVFNGNKRMTPADESYSFVTPPPIGTRKPVRFWTIGDSGTGRRPQADVHEAMLNYVAREGRPLDFWIHVGDMAYGDGRDVEFQARFFESYEPTLRRLVCWPTMGNHEGHTSKGTSGIGPYYDAYVVPKRGEAGGLASGTEAYYSFDYANIHFICLDSHDLDRKPGGAMAKWLKADLEKADADWLIAFWHHPPYTKGSHDSEKERDLKEMREHIMPIIESGGVDVVLTGHSHIYERSMLMDGAYDDDKVVAEKVILDDGDGDPAGDGAYRKSAGIHSHQGTVQVVAGHAGANLSRKGTMPVMKRTIVEYGSVLVDVDGDTLVARMIIRAGKMRDLFSIVKRGKVEPIRLALPWQPEEYQKPTNSISTPAAPPLDYKTLVPKNAEWKYLAAQHPQGRGWTLPDFDAAAWKDGVAGFGFGEAEARTDLERRRDQPASIYIRREFKIEQADKVTELGLLVNYRDAFIAYVNGREVARVGVGRSSGRNVQKVRARSEIKEAYVVLKDSHKYLKDGVNLLAIETHSASLDSPDVLIDPMLLLED